MPKAVCDYARYAGDAIKCNLTEQLCGNVKFCRQENRWKLNDNAQYCPIPKKEVSENERRNNENHENN